MSHYETYFMPHIWQRGEDISKTKAVSITTHTEKLIEAGVEGTDVYYVRIKLSDEEHHMTCTCPYAESGENCKHMAAVLITTSNEDEYHSAQLGEKQEFNHYKNLIKACDLDMIAEFFASQMMDSDQMKRSFVAKFSEEDVDVKKLIKEFKQIVRYHMGRERFINYRRSAAFFNELEIYFKDLKVMLNDGMVVECAKIFTSVMLGFDGIPLDDSAGYTTELYEQLFDFVEGILDADKSEASELIYTWLEKINEDPDSWYLKEKFYDIWSSQYSDDELLNRTILMLEKELSMLLAAGVPKDNYNVIHCLMNLVNNKELRQDSEASILSLIKPYENEAKVTRYLIKQAQKQRNKNEEERLLLFGIQEAEKKRHRGIVNDFKKLLCHFYESVGRIENYKDLLRDLVLENYWSLNDFNEYKSLFDDQTWLKMRSGFLKEMIIKKHDRLLPDIYVEENMPENLLTWLTNNPQLEHIRSYSQYLNEEYSDEVLTLFLKSLDQLASHSGNKSHYKNIVFWMEYIYVLPKGQEVIEQKVDEYRMLYKRRPNFIKVLNASF